MRWQCALFTPLVLAACSGDADSKRSGPPAGGVDPATLTRSSLGIAPEIPPPAEPDPAGPVPTRVPMPPPDGSASPAPESSAKPDAGAKGPMIQMTAEICRELGKKFTRLTVEAGGPQAQADKIGKDFAAKCIKEEAGQMVDRGEYDCVMAAKSVTDIPSCQAK